MGAGAIQMQYRRASSTIMSQFIGAPGEVTVDITSFRTVLHDGITAGGWPMEKAGLTKINDTNYTVLPSDVVVMFTGLSAARTVFLPDVNAFPFGGKLTVLDGTGKSTSFNITLSAFSNQHIGVVGGSAATSVTINSSTASSYGHFSFVNRGGTWALT